MFPYDFPNAIRKRSKHVSTRWWFQPIWSSNWITFAGTEVGVKIKNVWNQHLSLIVKAGSLQSWEVPIKDMARPTVGCVVVFEFHWVTKGQLPGDVRVFKLKTKKAINKHVERNALHHLPFFTWFQSWIITRNTNLKKHDKNELELLLRGVSLNSGWVLMHIFTSNPDPHPPNPGQATGPVCPSIRQVHCWVSRSQTLAPQRSTRHFCFPEKNWPGKKHDVVYGGSLIHQFVLDPEELIYDQPTWNCLVNFDRDSLLSPPLWSWMARSTACVKNEFVQAGKSRTSSHNPTEQIDWKCEPNCHPAVGVSWYIR